MIMELDELIKSVLKRVKPSQEEERRVKEEADRVLKVIADVLRERGIDAEPMLCGSIAKGTWLSGDRDIDVFIIFSKSYAREEIGKLGVEIGIEAAKRLGYKWVLKYAEHPYVHCVRGEFEVDIVPCYRIVPGEKPLTAADRTPLHTEYVLKNLSEEQKDEVRVLKRFLKGIGAYGAEVAVGGFSGYVAELLIIHYGTFKRLVEEVAEKWRPRRVVVDIEGFYKSASEVLKKFGYPPLVVVDPVDRERNAAAAVTLEKLAVFIAASRQLLRSPCEEIFFPPPPPSEPRKVLQQLASKGTDFVAIEILIESSSPDIAWGQAKAAAAGIEKILREHDFRPLYVGAWSDGESTVIVFCELESAKLPPVEKHPGPPVYSRHDLRFLSKWFGSSVDGPYIEGDRWVVLRRRRYIDAAEALRNEVARFNLGKLCNKAVAEGRFRVYSPGELPELIQKYWHKEEFREFMEFLARKRPKWLRV